MPKYSKADLRTILISAIIFLFGSLLITMPITNNVVKDSTADFYRYVGFDLNKQFEKLRKDPNDIKVSDLVKFNYYCDTYYGKEFDKDSSQTEACKTIKDLYLKSQTR